MKLALSGKHVAPSCIRKTGLFIGFNRGTLLPNRLLGGGRVLDSESSSQWYLGHEKRSEA